MSFGTPEMDALRRDFTINGLFFDPVDVAQRIENLERFLEQHFFDVGEMDMDDAFHGLVVRKADVMEKAPAQEGVGQLFFIV